MHETLAPRPHPARGLRQLAARLIFPRRPAAPAERAPGEQALQRLRMQLRAVFAAAPLGMAFTREGCFEMANAEFCALTGWSSGDLIGRSLAEVCALQSTGDSLDAVLPLQRRDGSVYRGRLQARLVDVDDPAAGTLWLLQSRGESGDETQRQAWAWSHDHLTWLLNRAAFEARLVAWLAQAAAGQAAALLLLDLDHFKQVNDRAGPDAGDALLCQVARVLQAQVRASDAVARLEGDAYALLLPGCVAAVALQLAARLQGSLAALDVAATVGVVELDTRASVPVAGWMARAHAAWYEAKYGGRGSVRLAAGMGALPWVVAA